VRRRNGTGATRKLSGAGITQTSGNSPGILAEGIRRNKSYESIIPSVFGGGRYADDSGGTVAQSMALLEQIVAVQRKMISEEINPDVTRVPQLWCLYKEVQEYYSKGFAFRMT